MNVPKNISPFINCTILFSLFAKNKIEYKTQTSHYNITLTYQLFINYILFKNDFCYLPN